MIDQDPTTKAIFSDNDSLYKLLQDGRLLRRVSGSWVSVPVRPDGGPVVTVAFGSGITAVVQTGRLSLRWSGGPGGFLEDNISPGPVAVTGSSGVVYVMRPAYIFSPYNPFDDDDEIPGPIFVYTLLQEPFWEMHRSTLFHPHPHTVAIAAGSDSLLTLQHDGSIWRYRNHQWDQLDNNPATARIVASGDELYQLHHHGALFRFTGTVCSGGSCPGWELLIAGGVGRIAVDDQLYALTQAQPLVRQPLWLPYYHLLPFPLQYVCPECL